MIEDFPSLPEVAVGTHDHKFLLENMKAKGKKGKGSGKN